MLTTVSKVIKNFITNPVLRNKLIATLIGLAIYRLLVVIPVPFVDVDLLVNQTQGAVDGL